MAIPDSPAFEPGNFLTRLALIVAYVLILSVVRFVLWGVLLIQLLFHLFGGGASLGAQRLGQSVSEYVYRVWLFLTYNTNERPFPFGNRKP